tara:strand:+ start:100 stop:291 length:192 start_codon:yes stop_codon:yes gene_type:complete
LIVSLLVITRLILDFPALGEKNPEGLIFESGVDATVVPENNELFEDEDLGNFDVGIVDSFLGV